MLSHRSFKASPGRYLGWKTVTFSGDSISSTPLDLHSFKWVKGLAPTTPLSGPWTCVWSHVSSDMFGMSNRIKTTVGVMDIDIPNVKTYNATASWPMGSGSTNETLVQI